MTQSVFDAVIWVLLAVGLVYISLPFALIYLVFVERMIDDRRAHSRGGAS